MGTLVNGIKEIFATSQTTATHLPVCASDGTPQGRISVGDLVSVLGGMKYKDVAGLDMNDVTTTGAYSTSSTTQNQPTTYATIIVYNSGGNIVQTAYNIYGSEYGSTPHIWSRIRVNGTWASWISINDGIPTFYKNYNDLASLQTALGVNSKLRNLGSVSVAAGATEVMNIGAYCGFVFIVNQPSGHLSLIAASYNHSTEIAHESSDGTFTASVSNKSLSITNNTGTTLSYSISLLL